MQKGFSLKAIAVFCFVAGLIISIFTYVHDYEVLPRKVLDGYQLPSGVRLPNNEIILTREIQKAFYSYNGAVKLSDLLEQDWDYVCMFERADSSDFYAGDFAAAYMQENHIQGKMTVPRRLQGREISLMLFIKDKTLVYTYYNRKDTIELADGKRAPLMAYAQCANRNKAILKTQPWNAKQKPAYLADRAIYFDDKE